MNILFCSLSDRPDFSDKIFEHNTEYFKRHNYRFVIEKKSLCNDRHPSWSKLLLVMREMKNNPSYDYIVWIDDDILIMDKEKCFEDFIIQYPFENFLVCSDCGNAKWVLNSGLFVCKNNDQTIDMLNEIYEKADKKYYHTGVWEQDAICDYYHKIMKNNPRQAQKKIKIIPHRTMQSIHMDYRPGDFSLHLAGIPMKNRMKMRDYNLNKK